MKDGFAILRSGRFGFFTNIMGSFKQHIVCSTATGILFGAGANLLGFSAPTCLLSAGLCSIAGMLPDVDSGTSRSFQECIYFAAGLSSVLLVQRLRDFSGVEEDIVLLTGACNFLFIRFVVGELLKRLTHHRGMFHSIPAAVFSGQLVFFLSTGTVAERLIKAAALTAGYLSHLVLDEICSVDSAGRTLRLKKSFGTALKLYDSHRPFVTAALYSLVVLLGFLVIKDPEFIEQWGGFKQQYAEYPAKTKEAQTFVEKITALQTEWEKKTDVWFNEQKASLQKDAAEFLTKQGTTDIAADSKTEAQLPALSAIKQKYQDNFVFSRKEESASPLPLEMQTETNGLLENGLLLRSARTFPLPNREPAPILLPAK